MNFPLHKDAEVLLSFINGNPDEPVITGAVPNSENPSLVNYNNPYESKITTAGGNRIHMGDQKGKEFLRLYTPFSNSSISLGSFFGNHSKKKEKDEKSPEASEGTSEGGISIKSEGYTETITKGNASTIVIGAENKVNIGNDNWTLVSPSTKTWIGPKMDLSFGGNLEWNFGYKAEINDTREVSFDVENELSGYKAVKISGGQTELAIASFEQVKNAARIGIAAAASLNSALAIAAGKTAEGKYSVETGESLSKTAIATSVSSAILGQAYLAFLKHLPDVSPYTSNIELAHKGIEISVAHQLSSPVYFQGSKIELSDHEIESTVDVPGKLYNSSACQSSGEIEMKVINTPGIANEILVSNECASMSAGILGSRVELKHFLGGELKIDKTGLNYENELATIQAQTNGFFTIGNKISAVGGSTLDGLHLEGCGQTIKLSTEGIALNSTSPLRLNTPAELLLNGTLVQIG
jgi:type VI secretion system secreted protein VgrG